MVTTLSEARFTATQLARARLTLLGIDINVAIYVVRHNRSTWPGRGDHQTWYQGENIEGRTFNVLVESTYPTTAKIIVVNELT